MKIPGETEKLEFDLGVQPPDHFTVDYQNPLYGIGGGPSEGRVYDVMAARAFDQLSDKMRRVFFKLGSKAYGPMDSDDVEQADPGDEPGGVWRQTRQTRAHAEAARYALVMGMKGRRPFTPQGAVPLDPSIASPAATQTGQPAALVPRTLGVSPPALRAVLGRPLGDPTNGSGGTAPSGVKGRRPFTSVS